ncbi:MAG: MauE/DoxX family redox-associated membrane protein [Waddliaceae bacterium]
MSKNSNFTDYWPLASFILVAVLAGSAVCYGVNGETLQWMHYVMGFLFCQFSLLKLFNISDFADGFQMYDLIAKRSRIYALTYPCIELILGLAYLAFFVPIIIYLVTIVLMLIGSIGVVIALQKGLDIYCPCMGTILKVPLSTVTLTEDLGMGAMALIMLISRLLY